MMVAKNPLMIIFTKVNFIIIHYGSERENEQYFAAMICFYTVWKTWSTGHLWPWESYINPVTYIHSIFSIISSSVVVPSAMDLKNKSFPNGITHCSDNDMGDLFIFSRGKIYGKCKKTNTRLMNAPVHSWLYRTIIRGLSSENSFLKGLSESTWPSDHEMVGPFPK